MKKKRATVPLEPLEQPPLNASVGDTSPLTPLPGRGGEGKQTLQLQPDLERRVVPGMVEYAFHGEPWSCERFDLLNAEIFSESSPPSAKLGEAIALLQQAIADKPRSWLIVRRLFGLMPANPGMGGEADDLRLWERDELRESLGLKPRQLQEELDAVRGVWRAVGGKFAAPAPVVTTTMLIPPPEDLFDVHPILKEYGFKVRWTDEQEMKWFVGRVQAFEKVLQESFSQGLGRNILNSELQLRRLNGRLNDFTELSAGNAEYSKIHKQVQDVSELYEKQIRQLEKVCPWASGLADKASFTGVMSDVTKAYQEYYANGDMRLVDGIFTATEIQVLMRTSTQMPMVPYRAGLVVYLNAARAGLWDPNFLPPFENGLLKKMDAAFQEAARAIGDESGEPLMDLESEKPEDEYPDLVLPSQLAALAQPPKV